MNQSFELWVTKDHKVQKWKRRKWTLDLEACYSTDFVLLMGDHNIIFYNTKNSSSFVIGLKSWKSPMLIYNK